MASAIPGAIAMPCLNSRLIATGMQQHRWSADRLAAPPPPSPWIQPHHRVCPRRQHLQVAQPLWQHHRQLVALVVVAAVQESGAAIDWSVRQ
jgi:hypothetical protein